MPTAGTDKAKPPLRLEWIEAGSLAENPRNWRRHPEGQVAALKDLLGDPEIGWAGACLYNERTKRLIDGHARRNAVDPETPIPVLVGSWTEAAEKKILLTLDPLAGMAEADPDALRSLIEDVQLSGDAVKALGDGLKETLQKAELIESQSREIVEDEVPQRNDVASRCKPGDLWVLGNHRLLCGDSTNAEDVARLMNDEKASLCFTSPPYGQQRDYTPEGKVSDWDTLMRGVFGNLPMAEDGQVLVNLGLIHRDGEWIPYWDWWIEWMRDQGWRRFGWYVWDQGWGLPGDWGGRCAPSHEMIFHFNKVTRKPNHCVPKQEENVGRRGGCTFRTSDGKLKDFSNPSACQNTHKIPDSVWRINRAVTSGKIESEHPAVFSVQFAAAMCETWTNPGGLVYEPFCGSGTTIVAAEQLGRKCRAMEISPSYCDIILARWEKLTGKTATRA